MIEFICLFFPALISLVIFQKLIKKELTFIKSISVYALFNLSVNGMVFLIKTYVLGTGNASLIYGNDMTPSIALNYLIIAIPLCLFFAVIFALIYKNIDLKIEREEKNQ